MAKSNKKKKKGFSLGFGIIKKLIYLAIFLLVFVALGGFDVKGQTALEHLDSLVGTDIFQDSRDGLVDFVYDRDMDLDIDLGSGVDSLGDKAKELLNDTKDGGKKVLRKIQKSTNDLEAPMETLTADDEAEIQEILKEKGKH